MLYIVRFKVSYMTTEFTFNDRQAALDFMENAWLHRSGKDAIESPTMTFTEEEEE